MEVEATCCLRCRERIQLKNREGGEVARGSAIVPQDIARVEAQGKAMGKTGVSVAKLQHLALELFVGHSSGVTVDDMKVGRWDFLGGGVAVGGRHVEHKASTRGMPFLRFVLLFCIHFLDVVELLVLDFVLVLGLLGGVEDTSCKGPEEVGGVRRGGGEGARGLDTLQDMGAVESGAPFC